MLPVPAAAPITIVPVVCGVKVIAPAPLPPLMVVTLAALLLEPIVIVCVTVVSVVSAICIVVALAVEPTEPMLITLALAVPRLIVPLAVVAPEPASSASVPFVPVAVVLPPRTVVVPP